ncbi:MAG: enoyl-CoA hydratase-related protein, partial [Pseudomonadota bacterium]
MPAGAESSLRIEDNGNHIVVVSDNPAQKNALTPQYHTLLLDAIEMATKEDRITSIILVGRGGYFSAGGNLDILGGNLDEDSRDARYAIVAELQDCVLAMQNCPKPIIAAVDGGAAGAGFSIAMGSDIVVAAEDAMFMPAYVKIGVVPDGGLSFALAQHLPHTLAAEICLLGAPVSAKTLNAHGLINRLTAPGEAEAEASSIATKLSRGAVGAHAKIKEL